MKLTDHQTGDDSPDLLVNASIFAGLLAFFAALVAVFAVVAKPPENRSFATADNAVTEQRYFGTFSEVALIYPDRVDIYVDDDNSFSVTSAELPGHPTVMGYLASIAESQRPDPSKGRRVLFAVQPGSANTMFWMESMAGDAGIQTLSLLWFNRDCEHIEARGSDGARMMEECLEVRQ